MHKKGLRTHSLEKKDWIVYKGVGLCGKGLHCVERD